MLASRRGGAAKTKTRAMRASARRERPGEGSGSHAVARVLNVYFVDRNSEHFGDCARDVEIVFFLETIDLEQIPLDF